jgi:hypothetical protein
VVGEIRDLCRGLIAGSGIEDVVKKQIKKLVGRLVQAEYRQPPIVELKDESIGIGIVDVKLHGLFELICRLETRLTDPCVRDGY